MKFSFGRIRFPFRDGLWVEKYKKLDINFVKESPEFKIVTTFGFYTIQNLKTKEYYCCYFNGQLEDPLKLLLNTETQYRKYNEIPPPAIYNAYIGLKKFGPDYLIQYYEKEMECQKLGLQNG